MSVKKESFSSQSTCLRGPLALQINKASPPDSSSAAVLLREHAKTARENSAINGQGHARPARGPRRPIHQQPRRHWALYSTAELALRPPTYGCSTGPRTSRPRSATTSRAKYRHTAHGLSEPGLPRAPQKHRSRPRDKQEARQRAEQRTTKEFRLPLQTSATPTVLAALKQGATAAARFRGARPDVPDSPEVPHCAVCLGSDRHLKPFVPLCYCPAE